IRTRRVILGAQSRRRDVATKAATRSTDRPAGVNVAGHALIAREGVGAKCRSGSCHTTPIREEEAVAVAAHLDVAKYFEARRGCGRADAEVASGSEAHPLVPRIAGRVAGKQHVVGCRRAGYGHAK